jgi:hypothetical protein
MSVNPNFLIIGAPKCGTTSLWHELRKHPNVFMPEEKEPAYFNEEYYYFRDGDRDNWSQYLARFSEGKQCAAIGEATPGYSLLETAPGTTKRIAEALPEARIITIVRHPLKRIESAWHQNVRMGRLPPDTFKDALWKYTPIISGSKYFRTISAYREHFSDEQILVLFLEDLAGRPQQTLDRCFKFLEVEPIAGELDRSGPKNESKNSRFELPQLRWFRSLKLWKAGRQLIPDRVKTYARSLFLRPLPSPDWDEQSLAWTIDQVKGDAYKTLEYGGKSSDFWNFSKEVAEWV